MKTSVSFLLMSAGLAFASVSLNTGCASTATRESTGEYVDDSAITTKVKSAMVSDTGMSGFQVGVETYKGVVQLTGFVDTTAQKAHAEQIARGVRGVKSVENKITVK
ncbi:MAG TPA: BON domain-containing protein [Opitutaceae bacterium]|nr:BON domain-containing protein [Opitutaceae bacterium]